MSRSVPRLNRLRGGLFPFSASRGILAGWPLESAANESGNTPVGVSIPPKHPSHPCMKRLVAVIFDMDGTLTRPCLDFDAIRAEMGLEREPILEAMARMPPAARTRADAILVRVEAEAAAHSELNDGALETVRALVRHGIGTALLTRNSRVSTDTVLARHGLSFAHVYTREDGPLKPDPAPVRTLCEALGVTPAETLMVGDYLFDIQAGNAAGARTALIVHDGELPPYAGQADHVIRTLGEVPGICGLNVD